MFDTPPPVDRAGLEHWIAERYADVPFITPGALAAWLADALRPSPVVVDVRSVAERSVSTLPGAIGASDGADAARMLADLDLATPVVVYCAGGLRSAKAARILIAAGHATVRNLEGGIFAWANQGRPLVADGRAAHHVHPCDTKWGALLAPSLHAWTPAD